MGVAKFAEFGTRSCSCCREAEECLIQHAKTGCLDCKNRLIEKNADRLRSFVVRLMYASPDSEDIFQQTIYQALRNFQQFRENSTFLTWLCTIALNEMRQLMRKRRRVPFVPLDEEPLNASYRNKSFVSSLDLLCLAETRRNVHLAVAALPCPFRKVVELHDFEGLSLQDIATLLHLSLPAVKSRHFRARKHLVRTIGCAATSRTPNCLRSHQVPVAGEK